MSKWQKAYAEKTATGGSRVVFVTDDPSVHNIVREGADEAAAEAAALAEVARVDGLADVDKVADMDKARALLKTRGALLTAED